MKVTVTVGRVTNAQVREIEYILGPCADDEYIVDPRVYRPKTAQSIQIEINVPQGADEVHIAEMIEDFAFQMREKWTNRTRRQKVS